MSYLHIFPVARCGDVHMCNNHMSPAAELPNLFNVCTHPLLGVDLFWIILSGMESWDFIVDGVKYETMVSAEPVK